MTANQIAFRNNLENERHDRATEVEINRHNVATEEIQKEQNRISGLVADYNHQYQETSNRLTEEYNRWYAKYSEATTAQKLRIEAEGNRIKSEMNDITRDYNNKMAEARDRENVIRSKQAEEDRMHNINIEALDRLRISNERVFRTQELEYKKTELNEQVNQWGIRNLIDVYSTYANAWRNPLSGFMTDVNVRTQYLVNPNSKIDVYNFLYGGINNVKKEEQQKQPEKGSSGKKSRGKQTDLTFNPFTTHTIRADEFRLETGSR